MSNAHEIAQTIAEQQGWTPSTLLDVVLDYVTNQDSDEAFTDYLNERLLKAVTPAVAPGR